MTATRRYRLGILEGDGIGPEIVPAAIQVVDAATAAVAGPSTIDWVPLPLGATAISEYGTAVPNQTLQTLAELDGWLLGPHDSASYPEPHRSALNPSGAIRRRFDLFANIRPAKSFEGARAVSPDTDLVDRAREHPGLLRRPQHLRRHRRVHALPGRGRRARHHHPAGRRADRQGRLSTWPAGGESTSRSCTRPTCSS